MCVFLQLNESLNVAARVQSVTPIICSRGHCPKSLDAPHLSASLLGTWCTLVPKCQEGGGGGGSLSGSSQVNHSEMSSFEFFKCVILSERLNLEAAWWKRASVQPCGRLFWSDEQRRWTLNFIHVEIGHETSGREGNQSLGQGNAQASTAAPFVRELCRLVSSLSLQWWQYMLWEHLYHCIAGKNLQNGATYQLHVFECTYTSGLSPIKRERDQRLSKIWSNC